MFPVCLTQNMEIKKNFPGFYTLLSGKSNLTVKYYLLGNFKS